MRLSLEVPINSVSFGQVSTAICRELYKRGLEPNIFPIGPVDISTQKNDDGFNQWLQNCINKAPKDYKRTDKSLKLWHINGGFNSVTNSRNLFSFHETDSVSRTEVNILNNQDRVIVTSKYTKEYFEDYGVKNVAHVPLGLDSYNFHRTDKKAFTDGRITFGILGKAEMRKGHFKMIRAWASKYGNNPKYFLNCAIYNPFLVQQTAQGTVDHNNNLINQITEGKKYFNIQFLGYMPNNETYNSFLNSNDVVLSLSGGEGFNLPLYQSMALGKHAVVLNAHVHKDFCNAENSVLVQPSGKIPCYDGVFFHETSPFNKGNFFDFSEESFIQGCEDAIARFQKNPVNENGLKLADRTYKEVTDDLLSII